MPRFAVSKYVVALCAFVVFAGVVVFVTTSRGPSYQTAEVQRGKILQEVLASGNVASPDSIDLQFQNGGRIIQRGVETGDKVGKGEVLARLDASVLEAERSQAASTLDSQKAELAELSAGTRPEEIAVTEAQVESDKIVLAQANKSVIDAIGNAYTVSDSAVKNTLDQLFDNPLTNPSLKVAVSDSNLKSAVEQGRPSIGLMLATWMQSFATLVAQNDLSSAENIAQKNLQTVSRLLSDANDALSSAIPTTQIATSQINTWMAGLAAARASLNAAISSLTVATTARKNAASTQARDEKNLALLRAGATATAITSQQAKVEGAVANVNAIDAEIALTRLVAPTAGVVTKVNGEVGETVAPAQVVVSMMPESKLQIDVNLSEDAVAYVSPGQPVRIKLDAFGAEKLWQGTVQKVDPAETVIGGAIYYKTTVIFDMPDERVKSGMTADVWIQTGMATSTLFVPASALQKKGTENIVQVLKNGAVEERVVKTGLKGADGNIEILTGLSEGEKVVTGE